ncbi:carbohydrate porin [Thermovibrio sp.]
MRKTLAAFTLFTLFSSASGRELSVKELQAEIEALKAKLNRLEAELEKKKREEEVSFPKGEFGIGGTLYYQGASAPSVKNPSGAGYTINFEFTLKSNSGGIYGRLHGGEGSGADGSGLGDSLYANLNTLSDDNPGNDRFRLLELYYFGSFLNDRLSLVVGKTEPFILIDTNEYANDEESQFVGKPFVNSPIIDPEDYFAPMLGFDYKISEAFSLQGVAQSNFENRPVWNGSSWEEGEKDPYQSVFDKPLLALQLTYSPEGGNYRFYLWNDRADFIKVGQDLNSPRKPKTVKALSAGVSFDQKLTERLAVFGRFSVGNTAYPEKAFLSLGIHLSSLFLSRPKDEFAFAVGALPLRKTLENHATEVHFEGYYKIYLNQNLNLTPDFQLVLNPGGDASKRPVYAGSLRMGYSF